MSSSRFLVQVSIYAALAAGLAWALHLWPRLSPYTELSIWAWSFFVGLSWVFFFMAQAAAKAENPNTFSSVFFGLTGLKMLLSLGLIFAYQALQQPEDSVFILPFFLQYAIFTVLEVRSLSALAKPN